MKEFLLQLRRDEDGQDLIEYTLLLAFMMFCVIAMLGFGGDSIKGIVNASTSQINAANSVAAAGA